MENETLLLISSIGSTIATFLAVVVALVLPFILEYKREKNILNLIKKEYESNKNLIEKVKIENVKDYSDSEILKNYWISEQNLKLIIKSGILWNVNLNNWLLYKEHLAISNSEKYLYYQKENENFQELKNLADNVEKISRWKFNDEQRNNMNIALFESLLKSTIEK